MTMTIKLLQASLIRKMLLMVNVECITDPERSISLDFYKRVIEMVQEWKIGKMEVQFMKGFFKNGRRAPNIQQRSDGSNY